MRRALIAAGLILASLAPSALAAKDPPIVPSKPIEEKYLASGQAAIAPDKGYIFLRAPSRFMGTFVRVPDAQDRADYQFMLDKAFNKAVKAYPVKLELWQRDLEIARQLRGQKLPEKPEEPNRETFSIGDIAQRTAIGMGPLFMFSKSEDSSEFRYMQEVKPGTYIYYGPVMFVPNGAAAGTCFCMGSVRFEVRPGEITDLGDFLTVAPDAAAQHSADILLKAKLEHAAQASFGLPGSLAGYRSAPAQFRASGKLNNIYGITISRMPPVPGVLAYDRDTVIDVASGANIAPGTGKPFAEDADRASASAAVASTAAGN